MADLDPKSLEKLAPLHPALQTKVMALINMAAAEGHTLRITQGLRTFAEQDILFNQWRDHKDNDGDGRVDEADEHVTNAAGGQSDHNYGLAVDFIFVVNGKGTYQPDSLYLKIGHWAANCGLAWGGNWKHKDLPHVELSGLPNWRVLLGYYKQGGLPEVWKHFQ